MIRFVNSFPVISFQKPYFFVRLTTLCKKIVNEKEAPEKELLNINYLERFLRLLRMSSIVSQEASEAADFAPVASLIGCVSLSSV